MPSTLPDDRLQLRTVVTADLTADETALLRSFLDAAFGGGFGDDDWSHALGGVHVLLTVDGVLAAHASVVARQVLVGGTPCAPVTSRRWPPGRPGAGGGSGAG